MPPVVRLSTTSSCLHNLGEFDAAQAYYEQAVESFRKASSPLVDRIFYGDINRRRIEFVKERLIYICYIRVLLYK